MTARFKLDENIPKLAADDLRTAGHDVHTVLEERLAGADDSSVLDAATGEGRILITLDLDFSDIRMYPPIGYGGIWVLRTPSHDYDVLAELIRQATVLLRTEAAAGTLWIVEPTRIRIRGGAS